jgi:hypothetical protein
VNIAAGHGEGDDGIDYRAPEQQDLHEQLDRTVKFLANDPANADKPEQWFLDEAHAMVKARTASASPQPPLPGPAAAPPRSRDAQRQGAGPCGNVPPNIARNPPAADSDDGGEFAHLRASRAWRSSARSRR